MKFLSLQNFSRLLIFLFACGIFFHWFPPTKAIVIELTDPFLLLMNSGVLFFILRSGQGKKILLWIIITLVATFMLEYTGIQTGQIFGNYFYGAAMSFKIASVPLVIALNWVVLILGSFSWAERITRKPVLQILTGMVLIVLFDLILEPLAMQMDYWQWENGKVPARNYFAWAAIAGLFLAILKASNISFNGQLVRLYFVVQIVFFLLILFLL